MLVSANPNDDVSRAIGPSPVLTPANHRAGPIRIRLFLLVYSVWILLAEAMTVFGPPRGGLWLHVALFAALLLHGALDRNRPTARTWPTLAFAPLIRIISLTTPLAGFPLVYWYLLTGIPLLLGVLVLARSLRVPRKELALQARLTPAEFLVGLSGIGLGYLEYLILRPQPLAPPNDALAIAEAAVILVVFTGFVEEMIFRGLMQGVLVRVLGRLGVVYVAVVFRGSTS